MTKLLTSILVLFFVCGGGAGTFFGPTTSTNRLLVDAGEALLLHKIALNPGGRYVRVDIGEKTVWFSPDGQGQMGSAVAGPAELVATNSVLVSYTRLITTNLLSVPVFSNGGTITNHVVTVGSGKRIRFFSPLGGFEVLAGRVNPEIGIGVWQNPGLPVLLDGPVNIWSKTSDTNYSVLSFLIEDQFSSALGAVGFSGAGGPVIAVERSSNLTNWVPSMLLIPEDSGPGFFRLRSSKD